VALIAALLVWAAFLQTWGFSLLLAPICAALSVVAWFRSRRDGLSFDRRRDERVQPAGIPIDSDKSGFDRSTRFIGPG
jgi:hypothetical protein